MSRAPQGAFARRFIDKPRLIATSFGLLALLASSAIGGFATDARAEPAPDPQLKQLRQRLERIYYEQDLLVRNERGEAADLQHQEQELEALEVYGRIPFAEDITGLKRSLQRSATGQGLKLVGFERTGSVPPRGPKAPSKVFTDQAPPYRLGEGQIVHRILFRAKVRGSRARVLGWIRSWPSELLRLAEAETRDPGRSISPAGSGIWLVRAHAFRFDPKVKFPTLEPRDPMSVLPAWARREPDRFARERPQLWSYVTRVRERAPRARPLYKAREQTLLNTARLEFFLSKAAPMTARN
jgi:hypothetical protein